MGERLTEQIIIANMQRKEWEPLAASGCILVGNDISGQIMYLEFRNETEDDAPPNFTELYLRACNELAPILEEGAEELAQSYRSRATRHLLPGQTGAATEAQALTDIFSSYYSYMGAFPIEVQVIDY